VEKQKRQCVNKTQRNNTDIVYIENRGTEELSVGSSNTPRTAALAFALSNTEEPH